MKIRNFFAIALLAPAVALAAPASKSKSQPKPAPVESQRSGDLQGLEVGGFVGYETSDFSGLALRLDAAMPFRELSPQVKLSFVGSVGYSHLTYDYWFAKFTSNVFKIVPAARFTIPVAPQLDVFGDVGIGLAHIRASWDLPYGFGSASSNSTNLMMRLGVGAWYQANPKIKVGAMIDLDPIFGNYGTDAGGLGSQTFWNLLVGAMFQI
ncbi:MAG TPA: hypothetical protein VF875_05615 [Anaeromyxobacter sp.]